MLKVKVQVYEFDEKRGHRSGTSKAGKPYEFFEQEASIIQNPDFRDCPTKVNFSNRSEILPAGIYIATVVFRMGRYQHEADLQDFVSVSSVQKQAA